MPASTQMHNPHFRKEIAEPFFQLIKGGESCVVAGIAGLGKSRLLQFLLQEKTNAQYLGEDAQTTLLVWADCNRMIELSPWGLYELLLTALLEKASDLEALRPLCEQLIPLRTEAILQKDALLAQRNLELTLRMLCNEHGVKFALILDEFDACYRTLPPQVLANLLALRDANKYRLCYALFMRDHPGNLRNPDEVEGFYELLSRSVLYLQPYTLVDAQEAIQLIVERRQIQLPPDGADAILNLSGGHPGLIVGLLASFFRTPPDDSEWLDWAKKSGEVQEECRKIWEGLRDDEKRALHYVATDTPLSLKDKDSVLRKGLLRAKVKNAVAPDAEAFFSPLFQQYVRSHAALKGPTLNVDKASGIVWIEGKASAELTDKEYDLALFLANNLNQLCGVEEIIAKVWPGDEGIDISPNAVAALVRRLRLKIEPNPSRPQYLVSVKGRGYRLTDRPDMGGNGNGG